MHIPTPSHIRKPRKNPTYTKPKCTALFKDTADVIFELRGYSPSSKESFCKTMAASTNSALFCLNSRKTFSTEQNDCPAFGFSTSRRTHLLKQDVKLHKGRAFWNNSSQKPTLIVALAKKVDSGVGETSMSDAIKKFYRCINEKNLKQMEIFISKSCVLEDSFFPYQFKGRKDVLSFYRELMESMGKKAQFKIGHVCEGDQLIASVEWHMEWEEDELPFSRGCSIFQFSMEENKLVIRKAQIITEPPIKPGKLSMAMLKMLTSLFDQFPKAAKWFLKSQKNIQRGILIVYTLVLAPIVKPLFALYTTLWNLIVRLFGYLISIFHFITKHFGPNDHQHLDLKSANDDDDHKDHDHDRDDKEDHDHDHDIKEDRDRDGVDKEDDDHDRDGDGDGDGDGDDVSTSAEIKPE